MQRQKHLDAGMLGLDVIVTADHGEFGDGGARALNQEVLRLALGRGLIGMVLADLYTAISGIGYLIVRTAATYQVNKMFVPIVTLGLLGVTLTWLLRVLERTVAPWTSAQEQD